MIGVASSAPSSDSDLALWNTHTHTHTHTLPSQVETKKENLSPQFWATAAFAGNGLLGVRVQTEQGQPGVLRLLLDNNNLGRGAKRLPVGFFRLNFTALASPGKTLRVQMRQHLHTAVVELNVTDVSGASQPPPLLATVRLFVLANLSLPMLVANITAVQPGAPPVALTWTTDPAPGAKTDELTVGGVQEARQNVSATQRYVAGWLQLPDPGHPGAYVLIATANISSSPEADAAAIVQAGARLGWQQLWAAHTAWWTAVFWPQSFVSIGHTRLESFYYAQLYRFVSADRVGLHGLQGAFGPSSMFNYWPDDVWDMNEEVISFCCRYLALAPPPLPSRCCSC